MTDREDLHRLIEALPETQLPALEQILRACLADPPPVMPRPFASTGTLPAEHDLAERSAAIARENPAKT
jgi:hypothetical protein